MSLKSILHRSQSEQDRNKQKSISNTDTEFCRAVSSRNDDETTDLIDDFQSYLTGSTGSFVAEQQAAYRARRRSSVQILDKKFIQSLSSHVSTSLTSDTDSNAAANASEDACECELEFEQRVFPLLLSVYVLVFFLKIVLLQETKSKKKGKKNEEKID